MLLQKIQGVQIIFGKYFLFSSQITRCFSEIYRAQFTFAVCKSNTCVLSSNLNIFFDYLSQSSVFLKSSDTIPRIKITSEFPRNFYSRIFIILSQLHLYTNQRLINNLNTNCFIKSVDYLLK